jgi:hypothetical protein
MVYEERKDELPFTLNKSKHKFFRNIMIIPQQNIVLSFSQPCTWE